MPKKQTQKSKYPSKYSPGSYITAAQYILELICEKKATYNQTTLPIKFWNLPEWKKFYSSQLRKCYTLLKQFDEKAIIRGLENNKAKNIYSLYAPWLVGIIKDENILVKQEEKIVKNQQPIYRNTTTQKPRRHIVQKSSITKLMDLDNNE